MPEMEENNYILYGPRSGKSLKRLYPEINEDPALKDLPNEDVLFAWLIGIPGSPIDSELTENIRYRTAAAKAIPNNSLKKERYASREIPEEVKAAIRIFEKKSPEARLMANQMTQKAFYNLRQLLDVDVKKDFLVTKIIGRGDNREEVTETDWTGRKNYADMAVKITEALPDMVKKMEEGYGMIEKQKENKENGLKAIDIYHASKK